VSYFCILSNNLDLFKPTCSIIYGKQNWAVVKCPISLQETCHLVDKMSGYEMPVDKMPLNEMSQDKMV